MKFRLRQMKGLKNKKKNNKKKKTVYEYYKVFGLISNIV